MKEIFENGIKFVSLQVVPKSIYNVIFVTFHANPIGGHHYALRKFHKICQRYFWTSMYQYWKIMLAYWRGRYLDHRTVQRSTDLVYGFPIDAPMRVLFVDIDDAGHNINFDGNNHHLIAACVMTGFDVSKSTKDQTSKTLASALMKILLRFGFYYTIVVIKSTSLLNVFTETASLLYIRIHFLYEKNHDPVIVERMNCFLNISQKILQRPW